MKLKIICLFFLFSLTTALGNDHTQLAYTYDDHYPEEPREPTSGEEHGDPTSGEEPGDPTSGEEPGDPTSGEEPGDPTSGEEHGDPIERDGYPEEPDDYDSKDY